MTALGLCCYSHTSCAAHLHSSKEVGEAGPGRQGRWRPWPFRPFWCGRLRPASRRRPARSRPAARALGSCARLCGWGRVAGPPPRRRPDAAPDHDLAAGVGGTDEVLAVEGVAVPRLARLHLTTVGQGGWADKECADKGQNLGIRANLRRLIFACIRTPRNFSVGSSFMFMNTVHEQCSFTFVYVRLRNRPTTQLLFANTRCS